MDLKLKNRVAMVAAASKGLGFGIARELAREGALLSICSRTEDDVISAAGELEKMGGTKVLPVVADVSRPRAVKRWSKATFAKFGQVDILVVNAGGPPAGEFLDFEDSHWQSAFELTLMSAVRLIRQVLPAMIERQTGSILTVTSLSVKEPIDQLLLSNVFRAGVTGLVKTLSREIASHGIRVNNLIPGRMDTERLLALDQLTAEREGLSLPDIRQREQERIPLGKYGSIEEFGRAAAFLVSPAASYITGTSLTVDGGILRTVW